MKKIFIIFSVLAITVSSCSLFDISPKTDIEAEEFFSDEFGFQSATAGLYVLMSNSKLYAKNLTFEYAEKLVQRYDNYKNQSPTDKDRQDIYNYTTNSNSKTVQEDIWSAGYNVIVNANNLLSWLEKTGYDVIKNPDHHRQYKGEALAIRGMLHFELLRFFGPIYNSDDSVSLTIPYRTTVSPEAAKRLPANQVVTNVIADLTEAYALLKDNSLKYNTRFTEWSVKALLARVELYRNNKPSAYLYAKEVVAKCGRNLNTNIEQDAAMKQETLLGVNFDKLVDYIAPYFANISVLNEQLYISEENLKDVFLSDERDGVNDIRSKEGSGFIFIREHNSAMCRKYLSSNISYYNFIPLIKLAEMYYILAESAPANERHRYINTVRNARGISKSLDYEDLTDNTEMNRALNREYQKEFFAEGQYFHFLKRLAFTDFYRNPFTEGFNLSNYTFPLPDNEIEFGWKE